MSKNVLAKGYAHQNVHCLLLFNENVKLDSGLKIEIDPFSPSYLSGHV